MSHFKIIAHRGASEDAVDNRLEAFQLAIAQGAELIETDVRCTKDGVLVLAHDAELVGHSIANSTLQDLQASDPSLLTVAAAIRSFGDQIPFCWEVKAPGIEATLVNLVKDLTPKNLWERTEFTSFLLKSAAICQQLAPANLVGWLTESWDDETLRAAKQAKLRQICPPADRALLNPELNRQAAREGFNVRVWRIESPDEVPRLVEAGVHGGTVNFPQQARATLSSRIMQNITLYQDDLIQIYVPSDPHISPQDGGHLIVEPLVTYTGIESCPRDLRHRLMDAAAATSAALLTLPQLKDGIINVQDNGNWFYRDETGSRSSKRLHLHIYGRAPGATEQPFGEALRFPTYAERQLLSHPGISLETQNLLRQEIVSRMRAMLA